MIVLLSCLRVALTLGECCLYDRSDNLKVEAYLTIFPPRASSEHYLTHTWPLPRIYRYKLTNGSVPIIGLGGIATGEHAYEKIRAGAR